MTDILNDILTQERNHLHAQLIQIVNSTLLILEFYHPMFESLGQAVLCAAGQREIDSHQICDKAGNF